MYDGIYMQHTSDKSTDASAARTYHKLASVRLEKRMTYSQTVSNRGRYSLSYKEPGNNEEGEQSGAEHCWEYKKSVKECV
jgi:hypothetical protein